MAESLTPLRDALAAALAPKTIPVERFREIIQRLYAWGTIVRDEDGVERALYDDACRIEDLLADYFSLAGFRLVHERRGEFYRLYPPGAQVPGLADTDDEPVPSLRARLSADFVAAALALRFLYQQGLLAGGAKLNEAGEVRIKLEELAACMMTQIHHPLPETATDRMALLASLRRHRLLAFAADFSLTDEEAHLSIRPTILGVVSEDALTSALESEGVTDEQAPAAEQAQPDVSIEDTMQVATEPTAARDDVIIVDGLDDNDNEEEAA